MAGRLFGLAGFLRCENLRLAPQVLIAGCLVLDCSAAVQSIDGVWRSEVYGNVYEIRGVACVFSK